MLHPARGGNPDLKTLSLRAGTQVSPTTSTRENQSMKRALASGLITASLIAGGAVAVAAVTTKDPTDVPGKGVERPLVSSHGPQDLVSEDGVTRVFGANRYATAAAISQAYGWDELNTIAVYLASGEDYPDALSIGLTNFGDGPLLLVSPTSIPTATRNELTRLQPCFIDVIGGTSSVSDTVFDKLKAYADPALCEEP